MPRNPGKHRREQGARSLSRYDFLAATHGPAVAARLRASKDPAWQGGSDAELFRRFAEKIDPSGTDKDKPWRYLRWACTRYLEDPVLPEDLYKIGEDLTLFEDKKKRGLLRDGKADIQRYSISALAAFAAAVQGGSLDGFDDVLAKAPASVMDATTILYRGPEGIALVPHSREAAIHWSRGTRWCTGAENGDNAFFDYNISGPLVILFTAGKERYQVHVNSPVMDAQDKKAVMTPDLSALLERIDERFLKKESSPSWNDPPDWSNRNYVMMRVRQDGGALELAAPELQEDPDIVLEAVRENGWALKFAAPALRANMEIVFEAARNDETALAFVSWKIRLKPAFLTGIQKIFSRFTKFPIQDWGALDPDAKRQIFEDEIRTDWKRIAFAADCSVVPDLAAQREIFDRAREKTPEKLAKTLHIFPALRDEWKKRVLTLDEAAALLGAATAPAPVVAAGPKAACA